MHSSLRKFFGLKKKPPEHPYRNKIYTDEFDALYNEGLELTDTSDVLWRRDRFFNLYHFARSIERVGIKGEFADVGVWKGLSTFLLAHITDHVTAVDSFEGLSQPTERDGIIGKRPEFYKNSLDQFNDTLKQYKDKYIPYKGWIPEVFKKLPDQEYAFVHVDVDLVDPTLAAFDYFYPRIEKGGVLLFDDYASKAWEHLKRETDAHLRSKNVVGVPLSTGQMLVIKR